VVAATNQNLEAAVAEGRFRNDLYHRLSQFTLNVPALRQRMEDVIPLAKYFLSQHDPGMRFSDCAVEALLAHPWPGNIRELRNAVTKAAVLAEGQEIRAEDFRLLGASKPGLDAYAVETTAADLLSLDRAERKAIQEALAATGGHQQKAADRLGISRRTLSRKLKLYESERMEAAL
jgi:two-component system response regulator FlrC